METINRESVKGWAISIVESVEPADTFVIEDGFDSMADHWDKAIVQDEGRFVGGTEIATFAALVTPFLLSLFGDVVKEMVTDQAKKRLGSLMDRVLNHEADADEVERLRREIGAAIDKSRFKTAEKSELRAGFEALFAKLART